MKLQKAFFLVIALIFLVSFTSAVSDVSNRSQLAQVPPGGGVNPAALVVHSFTLVNSDTNQEIGPITNGGVIDIAQNPNITLRADAGTPPVFPGSVKLTLNGANKVENLFPYTWPGGIGQDDYVPWTNYTVGTSYNLSATAYEESGAGGANGAPLAINFTVINGGSQLVPETNSVTLSAPAAGTTVAPGATVPMTCDVTTATDHVVWKAVWSGYQNGIGVTDFVTLEPANLSTGSHTRNITIPANATAGSYQLSCVFYFKNAVTEQYPPEINPLTSNHNVTIGTTPPPVNATSISITAPGNNTNVLTTGTFPFSVSGLPGDSNIQKVDFYYFDGIQTNTLGTDMSPPFSINATLAGNRGFGCPYLTAKATLTNGTTLSSGLTFISVTDTPATLPLISCPTSLSSNTFRLTSPPWNANYNSGASFNVSATATNIPAGVTLQKVLLLHYGGNILQNGGNYVITTIATVPTPPYSSTYSIINPGYFGNSNLTDHIKAIAFYSNGRTYVSQNSIKINPPVALPSITSLDVINTSGQNLMTLNPGSTINIGTQPSVQYPPLGSLITIKANAGSVTPTSVKFVLSGCTNQTQIENSSPWSLFGDSGTTYNPWPGIAPGACSLSVTPYTGLNATGTAGTAFNVSFVITNADDVTPPLPPAGTTVTYRSATETRLSWNASATATTYKIYRTPGNSTVLGNVTTYTDTTAMPVGAYYNITASDSVGNESGFSTPNLVPPTLSTQFASGQSVQVSGGTATVYLGTLPNYSSTGSQNAGALGTISGTSVYFHNGVSGGNYWNVDFASGSDGWVLETSFFAAASGGAIVPTVYETQRSLVPNQVAVVCNSASSQSCQVADYYIAQRGIRPQNKVTLNISSGLISPAGTISSSTFATGFGGTNMRDYVLNQIQSAYTSAGLGTSDIQAAVLVWKFPYAIVGSGNQDCYSSSDVCATLTSSFSKGAYDPADSNSNASSSPMPANPYFQTSSSSAVTPRQSFGGLILTALLPFDAGNYNQGKQFVDQGVAADNTYPTGQIHMIKTHDVNRSNSVRTGDYATVPALFNQSNLATTYQQVSGAQSTGPGNCPASYPYFNVSAGNPGSPWWPATNYIQGNTGVLGYFTGLACPPRITTLAYRPGAVAVHMTSHGGRLALSGSSDQSAPTPAEQMPITRWLEAGVTFAGGTSKEPWFGGAGATETEEKFPKTSALLKDYYSGMSTVQSFWSSTKKMGDTNFAGEPLANPWKTSQVTFSGNVLTIKTTHIKPGESWNLQKSSDGSIWTTVQSGITAPGGLYGLKTVTYPNAIANECYRLVNPSVSQMVKIPVTLGSTWTATNGITNPEVCIGAGGQTPPDTNPPTAPTGIVISGTPTETQIVLDWANSTGNPVSESVFYNVYRNNGGATAIGSVPIASNLTTSAYTNTGLTAGTTYLYRISSIDAAGNESALIPALPGFSASTATPPPPPPPPPGGQVMGISGPVGPDNSVNVNPTDTAQDFYIACDTGNDSSNGLTPTTPWKTITKLNSSMGSVTPGWKIYFKRGEVCRGTITANVSGTSSQPITYDAYGSGNAPIITGADKITSAWAVHSGSIYKTTIATGLSPKYLFVGSTPQTLARTPNAGSWNYTDSITGNSSFTDSWVGQQATSSLVGANVVLRSSPWSWAKYSVTANSGTTLTWSGSTGYGNNYTSGTWEDAGWAYLVENKLAFLDQAGEWYYNSSTGELYFWAPGSVNPSTLVVGLSVRNNGMLFGYGRTDIKIKNLIFEGFNRPALSADDSSLGDGNHKRVNFENLEIRYSNKAIVIWTENNPTADGVVVKSNHIHDIYGDGIHFTGGNGHKIEDNIIENIGVDAQRSADTTGWNLFGIRTSVTNQTVQRNHIKNTGYIGFVAGGSGLITRNYVERPDAILNDGGAIAWDFTNGLTISENIVKDVLSDLTTMPALYGGYGEIGVGLYFGDKDIKNTTVDKNIIINTEKGIFMDHGMEYIGNSVTNNIIVDADKGLAAGDWSNYQDVPGQNCNPPANSPCFFAQYNDVVTNNKVYGVKASQTPAYQMYIYSNGSNAHTNFGTWNNNYYSNPYRATDIDIWFPPGTPTNASYTLAQWKLLAPPASHDINSTASTYSITDPNMAPKVFYNATLSATNVNIGSGGCTAGGTPMSSTQTIPAFGAVVVEYGNC